MVTLAKTSVGVKANLKCAPSDLYVMLGKAGRRHLSAGFDFQSAALRISTKVRSDPLVIHVPETGKQTGLIEAQPPIFSNWAMQRNVLACSWDSNIASVARHNGMKLPYFDPQYLPLIWKPHALNKPRIMRQPSLGRYWLACHQFIWGSRWIYQWLHKVMALQHYTLSTYRFHILQKVLSHFRWGLSKW